MGLSGRPTPRNDSRSKGERSELLIAGALACAGYNVLMPYGQMQRYDLVIEDANGQFWRVQCKTAWLSKDRSTLQFAGASAHYKHAYERKELVRKHYRGDVDYFAVYSPGDVDYFAVYSPDLQKTYLIPITDVGDTMNALRLVPTKNNQAKHVRWAAEYEL